MFRSIHAVNTFLEEDYEEAFKTIKTLQRDFGRKESGIFFSILETILNKIFLNEVNNEMEKRTRMEIIQMRKLFPNDLKVQQERLENLLTLCSKKKAWNMKDFLLQAGVDSGTYTTTDKATTKPHLKLIRWTLSYKRYRLAE